jgi:hypothetical protein
MVTSMLRGYLEMKEDRLTDFTLIVAIRRAEHASIVIRGRIDELRGKMRSLLKKYPISAIVVGALDDEGKFEPLVQQTQAPF